MLTLVVVLPIAPRELVVLCLGADGHVAFESVSEPCRDVAPASAVDEAATCSDGCGPCRDVPLITSAHASGRPSNDGSLLEPLSLVAMFAWSMDPVRDDSARHGFAPSRPRADISSRALVALLI